MFLFLLMFIVSYILIQYNVVLLVISNFRWWVFRAWGRVGTTIGGNKLEKFPSKESAVDSFKALFEEKTGNSWQNRNAFIKFPNRFYPLDIDYGVEDAKVGI